MAEPDVEEVRQQLIDAFEGADYPVSTPMDLLPGLPNGPATTFESGDWSMTVMDLQNIDVDEDEIAEDDLRDVGLDPDEVDGTDALDDRFPYDSPEDIANDLVAALQLAGELPR
ncbi:MAG: MTH865 family protein [Natrialbaceae archaeon]|nr:MTH865 family protein [Natrialbaceae archaeon]